ncbi:MAG: hypothetical protein GTO45_39580 [Candidatus Aminicenantes bacterium]|nr:hypothetical protein [Candidatus Aminicenantes bacterium]NIM84728.1 hypothetical protein [Candidatus Aminicenantes bacterium]NIN24222.1 hypothetical protein [Candidatus Aminicenantes bacterium]NIN47949.1 hypothetical protein [Candidatus Aminicenantes bacterium]NIN90885.1 hypothetical protein [Candidatus Aminicenantes bacterium]
MKKTKNFKKEASKKNRNFPSRKISETLIDFAKPFIDMVDENTTQDQLETGFKIAITVWNAVVVEEVKKDPTYLEQLRTNVLEMGENWYYGYAMIESLISRKKEFFADDLRAIGNFSITYNEGYLHVKAEARGIAGI